MRQIFRKAAKAAALTAIALATPAFAVQPVPVPPPSCTAVTFDVPTLSCLGFFSGNLITESGPKLTEALGHTDDLNPAATSLIEKLDWGKNQAGNPIDFIAALSGPTVIGLHFGGGANGYNGTAFWLLDVPNNTDTLNWSSNIQSGISNAGLYYTGVRGGGVNPPAVPEPATWAMMLVGFGLVGGFLRRQQRQVQRLRFA